MTKPEDIPQWAWEKAEDYFEWLIDCWPSTAGKLPEVAKERVARAILSAVEEEREAIAAYIEGKDGVIPGASVYARVVSRNEMPAMSGDDRDRLNKWDRRAFDRATEDLCAAIRSRKEA